MAALSDTNVPHPKRPRTSTFGVKILVERDSFGGNPEIIKKSLEDICKEAGCFINIDDYPGDRNAKLTITGSLESIMKAVKHENMKCKQIGDYELRGFQSQQIFVFLVQSDSINKHIKTLIGEESGVETNNIIIGEQRVSVAVQSAEVLLKVGVNFENEASSEAFVKIIQVVALDVEENIVFFKKVQEERLTEKSSIQFLEEVNPNSVTRDIMVDVWQKYVKNSPRRDRLRLYSFALAHTPDSRILFDMVRAETNKPMRPGLLAAGLMMENMTGRVTIMKYIRDLSNVSDTRKYFGDAGAKFPSDMSILVQRILLEEKEKDTTAAKRIVGQFLTSNPTILEDKKLELLAIMEEEGSVSGPEQLITDLKTTKPMVENNCKFWADCIAKLTSQKAYRSVRTLSAELLPMCLGTQIFIEVSKCCSIAAKDSKTPNTEDHEIIELNYQHHMKREEDINHED
ncbi:uncharacterized protein CELE_T24H10.5 [Caenorhabditis elegans]|uniref:Uncharacterized protein n=1 Tax=Caenorhabditis elegans TaxID=6239 RepID=Q22755_CAEEL|nr:Uncharacterized protein CELE_T24H10.5 [Caenorhabditis elegans]CAA90947.2 Uncharacterized protein CELE_T24H10.5 [Caenorhabditis elegans]|eukprot:NP_001317726.1 Uncharacterized protein CELE_T24H10.5 [Caenorhabditis elegans]